MNPSQEFLFKQFIDYVNAAEKAHQNLIEDKALGVINTPLSAEFTLALIDLFEHSLELAQLLGQSVGSINQNTLINLINKGEGATVQ